MTTREKPDSEDFVLDEEIDDYLAQLEEIATDVCEDNGREIFDKTMEPALDTGSLNIISKTIMNVLQRRQEHVQQDGEKEVCSSNEVAEVMLGILKNKNQAINQNRNPQQVEVINIESEKEEILGQETKTKDLHSMSGSEKKKKRKRSSEKDDDSKMKNKFTKNDKSAIDDDVMPSVKPFLEVSRCDLVKRRRDSDESSLSGMETVILPVRDPRRPWPVDVASKSKKNRELSPLPSLEEGRESSPFPISKSESDIEDAVKRSKLQSSISVPEFVGKSVSTSKAKTEIQKSTPENSKHNNNNNNVLIEQENKLLTLSSKVKRNSIWTSENKPVLYEECDIPESTVPVDSTKKRDVVHYGSLSPRGISPFSRSPSPPRKHKKIEYDIPESTVPVDSIKKRDIHYGSLSPKGISPFSRSPSPPRKHKNREYDIPESTVPVDSTKKRDMHYGSLSPRGISPFSRSSSPPRKHKKREYDIPESTVPVDSPKKRDMHYGSLSPRGISPFSRSSSPPRKHKKREYDIPESTVPVDSTKKRDMHYRSLSPKGISPFSRSPSPPRKHKKRKSRSRSPSRRKKRSRSRSPRNRKSQHKRCPYPQYTSKHHQSRSRERRDHCRRSKSMSISPPPCLRNKLNLPVEKVINSLLETAIAPVPTVPPVQVPSAPQAAVAVPIVNSTSQHDYYSYQDYQNQYWQGNYVNLGANYSSYGSYDYQQPFYLSSQEPSYNSYYSYPATTAYSDYQMPSTSSLPQQQRIDTSYPPPPLPEEQPPLPPPPPPPPSQSIESTIHSISRVSKPKPTLLSRLQSNLRYLLPEVTKKQPSPEVIEIINQALESPKKQPSSSPSTSVSTASIYEYVKKDNMYVQINKPVGNVTPIISKERQQRKPQLLHQKYKPIVFNLLQRNLKNSTDKNDVEKGIMQRSAENIKNKMCISANNKVQSDVTEIEVNAANEINDQNNIKIRKTTRWSRVDDTEMKTKKNAEEGIINNATERDFTPVKKTVQTEKTEIHLNLRESLHIDVNTKIIETELKNKADVDETVPADIVNNELQTKLKNTPSSEAGDLLENKLKSNVNVENGALIDTGCRNENKLGNKVNKEKFMQPAESKSTKTEIELSTKISKDVEINNEIENELRTEINKDKTLPSNTESNNIENNVGTEKNKDVEINSRTENELQTEINKDGTLPSNTEINNIENNVGSNVNKDETGVFRNKPETEITQEESTIDKKIVNKIENEIKSKTVPTIVPSITAVNMVENELNKKEAAESNAINDKVPNEIQHETNNEEDCMNTLNTDFKSKLECEEKEEEAEGSVIIKDGIKNKLENGIMMEPEKMDIVNAEVENKSENAANEKTVAVDRMGEKFKNDTGNVLNRKGTERSVVTDCKFKIEVQDEMDVVESKLKDEQIKNETEKINIVENEIRMEPGLMDDMNVEVENKPENAINEETVTMDRMGDKFKNDAGNELNRKDAEHSVVTDCKIKIVVQDEMDVVESKLEDEQIKNKTEKIDIVENEIRMEPELMDVMNVEVENKSENTANEKTVAVDGIGDKFKNDAGNELNRKDAEHSVVTDCKIKIEVQDEMDVVESKLEDQQKKETEQMDIVLEEIKINVRKIEIKEMDVKNTEAKENKLKLTDQVDIIKSELNSKNNTQRDVATNGSEHTKNKLKEDAMKNTLDTRNEAEIDKVINSADNSENLVMKSTKTDTLTQNEIKKPAEREQTDKCSKIRIELKSDAYQTTENLETNAESVKSQMELENKLNDSEGERKVPQKPKMTRSKSRNKTVALKINKKVANAKHKKLTKSSKIMAPNKEDEAACTTKVEGSKFLSEENKTEINETCRRDKEIANEEEKKQKAAVSSNIVGGNADVNSRFKNINDYKLLMNTSVVIQRIKLLKENKFADQGQDVNKSPPKSAQTSNAPCKVSGAVSPNCSNSALKSKEQKNQTHHHDVPETSKKSIQQSDADVLLEIARLLNVEQRTVSTQVSVVRNTLKGTVSAVSNKAADKKQINYINVIERVVKSLCES